MTAGVWIQYASTGPDNARPIIATVTGDSGAQFASSPDRAFLWVPSLPGVPLFLAVDTTQNPPVLVPFTPPPSTVVPAWDFLQRFTPTEQLAVQTACNASAQLALGLTQGLAAGSVNLVDATVKAWMAGLVQAGAITADRETAILTP